MPHAKPGRSSVVRVLGCGAEGGQDRYAPESRDDFARRLGAFLGYSQRNNLLDLNAAAAAQVTPSNVELYVAELKERVRSVTVWNCVYKLRMAAKLLNPQADFSWLAEIEKDLALVMTPRSQIDRLVLAHRLVEAGLTLVTEAERYAKSDLRASDRHPQRFYDRSPGGCARSG